MAALDIPLDITPTGGQASLHPDAQLWEEQRRQQVQQDALLAHQAKMAQAQEAEAQQRLAEGQQKAAGTTMRNDIAQWTQLPQYQVPFAAQPQEFKQHLVSAYPSNFADAPAAVNQAATDATGKIVGAENLPSNATISDEVGGLKVAMRPKNMALDNILARQGVTGVPPDADDDTKRELLAQKREDDRLAKEQASAKTHEAAQEIQRQRQVTRTQGLIQNNQAVRNFSNGYANYDSIKKNLAAKSRTGADDVALIQAAATMEAPGRSPTTHDFQIFAQTNGLQGNLAVLMGKAEAFFNGDKSYKRGRILDDATAQQIGEAAKRAVDSRLEAAAQGVVGYIQDLEDLGKDPAQYAPKALVDYVNQIRGGSGAEGTAGTAGPGGVDAKTQAALDWLKANPNDPRAPAVRAAIGK